MKAIKWGVGATGVLWGMQVRSRHCPACGMTQLEDGETSAISELCCNICGTVIYAGWSQPEVQRRRFSSIKVSTDWIGQLVGELGGVWDQILVRVRSARAWIWPEMPAMAGRPPIVYGLVTLQIAGSMVLGLLLLMMLLGALASILVPDLDPSMSPEIEAAFGTFMAQALPWLLALTCLLTVVFVRHTLCGCPWVYFASLAFALLWSLTILPTPISLAVILLLRRERARRYFQVTALDRPFVIDLLAAAYVGIGFALLMAVSGLIMTAILALLAPEVAIAMDPAITGRTFRVGIRTFCMALYFIGLIIACAATARALVRGHRWAHVVTVLLAGCGMVTLVLAPLGLLVLLGLLSSRSRRYFSQRADPLRPLAVDAMYASGLLGALIGSRYLSTHLVPTTLLALLVPQLIYEGWTPLEATVWRVLIQAVSTVAWGIPVVLVLALARGSWRRRRWAYVLNLSMPLALAFAATGTSEV
jgi:hypothetical protein